MPAPSSRESGLLLSPKATGCRRGNSPAEGREHTTLKPHRPRSARQETRGKNGSSKATHAKPARPNNPRVHEATTILRRLRRRPAKPPCHIRNGALMPIFEHSFKKRRIATRKVTIGRLEHPFPAFLPAQEQCHSRNHRRSIRSFQDALPMQDTPTSCIINGKPPMDLACVQQGIGGSILASLAQRFAQRIRNLRIGNSPQRSRLGPPQKRHGLVAQKTRDASRQTGHDGGQLCAPPARNADRLRPV